MRVDKERDLAAGRGQFGECGHADGHVVADASRLYNGLVRMLAEQFAAKMSNHAASILSAEEDITYSMTGTPLLPPHPLR